MPRNINDRIYNKKEVTITTLVILVIIVCLILFLLIPA